MSADPPVYNLDAPFVDLKTGKLASPWNMFFQQLVQNAQPIEDIDTLALSTGYQPNAIGTVYIEGTPSILTLVRGDEFIAIDLTVKFVPISIGDKLFVVGTTAKFIPQR